MADRATWSIVLECDTSRVPQNVLDMVKAQLEEMGRAIAAIEPSSTFWSSLRESGMRIDAGGWRFKFRADFDEVALVEVQPAR
jgi:hypothetical protein